MFDALGAGLARVPESDVAQPPLGQLLVDRDLLTEEQLQYALSEQGRTGLPIGQVLISLTYVTAATIAQALATQEGGVVRTEFGLSTGFGTPGLVALPPVSPPASASKPSWAQEADMIPLLLQIANAAVESAEELSAARTRVAELEHESVGLRQRAEAAEVAATRVAELEQEIANAAGASAEELSAARTRVAELEHEMYALRRHAETAQAADGLLAQATARISELESEVSSARSAASDRIQALAIERDARAMEAQQTQAQLASATENLRPAYERLHQFEIAQALQQHEPARTASPFAWQA